MPVEMQLHSHDGVTTGIERSRQNLTFGFTGESELQINTETLSFRISSYVAPSGHLVSTLDI